MLTKEQLIAAADAIDRIVENSLDLMRRHGLDRQSANQQAIAGSVMILTGLSEAARAAAKVEAAS